MLPGSTAHRGAVHKPCISGQTRTSHKTMVTLTTTIAFYRPSLIRSTSLHAASSKQQGQDTNIEPQQLQPQQLKPANEKQLQPGTQQLQQPAVGQTPATTPTQERDLLTPILVAVSLALYALIAVLGFADSLDTQQLADWQP